MVYPIVVGVDGSESALDAVRWAAGEAARRGLGLRLVHVYSTPVGLPGGIIEPAVVQDALRKQGKEWLDEAWRVAREVSGAHGRRDGTDDGVAPAAGHPRRPEHLGGLDGGHRHPGHRLDAPAG